MGDTNCTAATDICVLRPARLADIDGVLALAEKGGSGLTNLPPVRETLAQRLAASAEAIINAKARDGGAAIMLVAARGDRIVAVSGIFPRVGAEWPFYSYRLTRQASRSLAVGRQKAQTLLNLVNDFDGEAEVGMLFVDPEMRGAALGALAARGRYLFMTVHRDWFGRRVMAELRGWQDAEGQSPVWEAIGRHFYDMEFSEADRKGALDGNQFIADLGPRYPLYLSLLPQAAQAALGRPHDDGRPALDMLIAEGFRAGDYVDIFDGGPTVVAEIDDIRTVREARQVAMNGLAMNGAAMNGGAAQGHLSLVATGTGAEFRVARGRVDGDGRVEPALADALGLNSGDMMVTVPT